MSFATKCRGKECDLAIDGPSSEILDRGFGVHCRSVQELSLLFAVSQTLDKSFDLSEIVKPLLRRLRDMMGMERGMIAILNRDDGQILLSDAIGVPRAVPASQYFDLIHPLLQRTVEKAAPVITPNFREWVSEKSERAQLSHGLEIDAATGLISVPLKFGEKVIGTLSVERPRNSRQGWEADLRLLTMIASVIAQAARLRQDAAEQIQSLRRENTRLQEAMAQDFRPKNMIGTADSMRSVYYHIEQVAQSSTTVLIRGESGTGKELVAKALHEKSDRQNKSFVKVNCAALPDSIIESELFGHEKGAFTGALSMRKGRFELANRGTIFLDEIGDISAATQVKLLRVLQEREFERVGSQETMQVDVRVIAATSRNLEQMIADGSFREDLYYRLNVFPIYMPALRDRKCDVMLLADFFIEKFAQRQGVKPMRISSAAIDLLVSYHWPGNVREMENCMERAVLLAKGQSIKAHHLPPTLQKKSAKETSEVSTLEDAMVALEREMIIDALKDTGSNMAEAARRLGLTERKMGLRVKKYDIELSRYK